MNHTILEATKHGFKSFIPDNSELDLLTPILKCENINDSLQNTIQKYSTGFLNINNDVSFDALSNIIKYK